MIFDRKRSHPRCIEVRVNRLSRHSHKFVSGLCDLQCKCTECGSKKQTSDFFGRFLRNGWDFLRMYLRHVCNYIHVPNKI